MKLFLPRSHSIYFAKTFYAANIVKYFCELSALINNSELPGSSSSAVRKNCRRLPNRERNTTENSVTCSV